MDCLHPACIYLGRARIILEKEIATDYFSIALYAVWLWTGPCILAESATGISWEKID